MSANALLALARVLRGPEAQRFRFASASRPGAFYTITVGDGADVTCDCPGFEFRGACRHARDVKAAIAKHEPVPAEYEPWSRA